MHWFLSRFRFCHCGVTPGMLPAPLSQDAESMKMSHSKPAENGFQVLEMIPSGTAIAAFPAGAIAQAWLDEHSQQLTWVGLTAWLSGSPSPAN